MYRTRTWTLAAAALALGASLGAAPATPTYIGVERVIAQVEADWQKPGAQPGANAPGWNAVFKAVRDEFAAFSAAKGEDDRLRSLNRLYQISAALDGQSWPPAVDLRNELRTWLRPRVTLAWATRHLVETVRGLPAAADPSLASNRSAWEQFVDNGLGAALRDYESAPDVRKRQTSLGRVYTAINALQKTNSTAPWGPSLELQRALDDLYNGPNLQATADVNTVSPKLANYVVQSGPVTRNGQTSYVTAGPYLGFGLMASDDGIVFYNRQALSSVAPIRGFQQQVAGDAQGKRAAKLYQFDATAADQGVLTVIAVLRPTGIQLFPDSTHNISANVGSAPQPGKGLVRGIAAILGQNQYKITQKVYEGAYPKIYQGVLQGSRDEAADRTAEKVAQTNAQLANVFVGPDKLAVRTFEVDSLRLRSRPEFVLIDGRVKWRSALDQVGAEMPKPFRFATTSPGVSADIHLGSIMTNMTRGYLQTEAAQKVTNLTVVTRKIPPGAPASEGFQVTQNTDFATFLKAVAEVQAANDPKLLAIRVKRPGRSPEFSVDRNGNLVASVHDFSLDVPAPASAARGGLAGPPAKVYRIEAPDAEFSISFQIAPAQNNLPIRLTGRIEGFDPGPGARVLAINDDETKATPLNAFTSNIVLNVFGNRLKGQPIDAPLTNLNIPGFALSSVSPVDPSGWIRVVLTPIGTPVTAAPTAVGVIGD